MTFPEDFLNKIVLGDCLSVMHDLPDQCVDMILCDLPYGRTSRNDWDNPLPFEPLWESYQRIAKDRAAIVLTATQPFAAELIASNYALFRYDWIWVKNKSTGFLNAVKMPLRQHESILVFYKELPIYNPQKTTGHQPVHAFTKRADRGTNYGASKVGVGGGGATDRYPTSVLSFPVVNNDSPEKIHPTQKPIALFEYLIRTYTNEGQIVLDNCIGSGTTALACLNSNRQFIGIEQNAKFHAQACRRVVQELHTFR